MRPVHVSEIFNKRLIALPKEAEKHVLSSFNIVKGIQSRGGIYVYRNSNNEPLYVGISRDLHKRVADHLRPNRGNKDLHKFLTTHKDCSVTVYYEENEGYRDVYESYLIDQLRPRYNVAKTGRDRVK